MICFFVVSLLETNKQNNSSIKQVKLICIDNVNQVKVMNEERSVVNMDAHYIEVRAVRIIIRKILLYAIF